MPSLRLLLIAFGAPIRRRSGAPVCSYLVLRKAPYRIRLAQSTGPWVGRERREGHDLGWRCDPKGDSDIDSTAGLAAFRSGQTVLGGIRTAWTMPMTLISRNLTVFCWNSSETDKEPERKWLRGKTLVNTRKAGSSSTESFRLSAELPVRSSEQYEHEQNVLLNFRQRFRLGREHLWACVAATG